MNKTKSTDFDSAFDRLRQLSATIGANSEIVQGAGGNVSIKKDGNLFVKASGTWLKDTLDKNIFVFLALDEARHAVQRQGDLTGVEYHSMEGPPLRPSIETPLHALMPQPVVIHVHCVNTIAYAVRQDVAAALGDRLAGLDWAFVPYAKPGSDLSARVQERIAAQYLDVLVLGNHGLVVGGESVDQAAALLYDIHRRLAPTNRIQFGQPDGARLDEIAAEIGWRRPLYETVHTMALNEQILEVASGGSLYPDHVVFLGRGVARGEEGSNIIANELGGPKLCLLPGIGALVTPTLSKGGEEMARALALVAERAAGNGPLRYLTAPEEDELLDWDAEKYRQNLEV